MIYGKTHVERAEWYRWFAWRPVTLRDGRFAWLRWLDRRHPPSSFGERRLGDEYRLPANGLGYWLPKGRR